MVATGNVVQEFLVRCVCRLVLLPAGRKERGKGTANRMSERGPRSGLHILGRLLQERRPLLHDEPAAGRPNFLCRKRLNFAHGHCRKRFRDDNRYYRGQRERQGNASKPQDERRIYIRLRPPALRRRRQHSGADRRLYRRSGQRAYSL